MPWKWIVCGCEEPLANVIRSRSPSRLQLARAEPGHAVLLGGVDAVEVDRVRMARRVGEGDAQQLPLAGAQRRAGDPAVVGPGGEADAGGDLDLPVHGGELPLAERAAVG